MLMNILFLCTSNLQRSPTAEKLFSPSSEHEFRSVGLEIRNCLQYRTTICTEDMLKWADRIYVFEKTHLLKVMAFGDYSAKVVNLNIADIYECNDPELIKILLGHPSLSELAASNRSKGDSYS